MDYKKQLMDTIEKIVEASLSLPVHRPPRVDENPRRYERVVYTAVGSAVMHTMMHKCIVIDKRFGVTKDEKIDSINELIGYMRDGILSDINMIYDK